MGRQQRSTSHYHTQVKEAREAKDIDLASPHSDRLTGAAILSSNGEERTTISKY